MLVSLSSFAVVLAGGLPQLNFKDYAPQLIWLFATFGVLWWLMAKVALPKVGGVIEERAQRIQRDLDEAARLKTETEKAIADYEASLASARTRAGGIAKDIRDKLTAEVDLERARVDKQVATKVADAEKRIADTKKRAMSEVGQIAAETAEAIVGQLQGKPASKDAVASAVKSVLGS